MTTIDEIKNECLGWTGLQSLSQQGQFAQRAAKATLDLITYVEEECHIDTPQETIKRLCRTWEESK